MPAAFFLLLTVMAGYAIAAFAASDAMAGFAASSFVVGSVFGRLVAGRYLDVVGRRRLILLAMVGYIAASLAYLLAADLTLFLALRIVHGATFGLGNTALI